MGQKRASNAGKHGGREKEMPSGPNRNKTTGKRARTSLKTAVHSGKQTAESCSRREKKKAHEEGSIIENDITGDERDGNPTMPCSQPTSAGPVHAQRTTRGGNVPMRQSVGSETETGKSAQVIIPSTIQRSVSQKTQNARVLSLRRTTRRNMLRMPTADDIVTPCTVPASTPLAESARLQGTSSRREQERATPSAANNVPTRKNSKTRRAANRIAEDPATGRGDVPSPLGANIHQATDREFVTVEQDLDGAHRVHLSADNQERESVPEQVLAAHGCLPTSSPRHAVGTAQVDNAPIPSKQLPRSARPPRPIQNQPNCVRRSLLRRKTLTVPEVARATPETASPLQRNTTATALVNESSPPLPARHHLQRTSLGNCNSHRHPQLPGNVGSSRTVNVESQFHTADADPVNQAPLHLENEEINAIETQVGTSLAVNLEASGSAEHRCTQRTHSEHAQLVHQPSHTRRRARMVSVDEHELNELKKEVNGSRLVTQELLESLKMWKKQCKHLEEENNRLKVDIECNAGAAIPSETPTTSASKNSSLIGIRNNDKKGKKRMSKRSVRSELSHEFSTFKVPHGIVRHFLSFMDSVTSFAHDYTTEKVRSSWHSLVGAVEWSPNEVGNEEGMVHDYRGRVVSKQDHITMKFTSASDVSAVGAPLLLVLPDTNEGDQTSTAGTEDGPVRVESAYFPICPMEEARRGTLFTSTSEAMDNFIAQSVISTVRQDVALPISRKVQDSIFEFVGKSSVLKTVFQNQCQQVVSTRKRLARDTFFSSLGYKHIASVRPKNCGSEFDEVRDAEEATAFAKLARCDANGARDTSFWRLASFNEICNEEVEAETPLSPFRGVDKLFGNEAARKAFIVFVQQNVSESSDTSTMSIIRLDAHITSIIEMFEPSQPPNQEASAVIPPPGNHPAQSMEFGAVSTQQGRRSARRCSRKGGSTPLYSKRRYKELLPNAAARFLRHAYYCFKQRIEHESGLLDRELHVGTSGSDIQRLHNGMRQHTLAFRYPPNGHFYIALNHFAFSETVCQWVGRVMDCYVLHSRTLDDDFEEFKESDVLELMCASDVECSPESGSARVRSRGAQAQNGAALAEDYVDDMEVDSDEEEGYI